MKDPIDITNDIADPRYADNPDAAWDYPPDRSWSIDDTVGTVCVVGIIASLLWWRLC